jgi:hypothetical protein
VQIQNKGDLKMKRASWLIMAFASLATLPSPAIAQSAPSLSGQKATDVASRQARSVKDQVLTSTEMPAIRIEFDKGFKYVGGHNFIFHCAHCAGYSTHKRFVLGGEECAAPFACKTLVSRKTLVAYYADGCSPVD